MRAPTRPSPPPAAADPEGAEARWLIQRLTALLLEMRSPDGLHRALRSPYSRRGTCQTYRAGDHSPLCKEMFALLDDVADFWEQYPEAEQPEQLVLEMTG